MNRIGIRQKLLIFTVIFLASYSFIVFSFYHSNQKQLESAQWVQHTEQVINQAGNLLSLAKDIETASHGFVITGDSEFLEPILAAQKIVFTNLTKLHLLTIDNPTQQQRIDSLNFYMHRRLLLSLQAIEIRKKQGLEAAFIKISTKQGKHCMDRMRQITNAIQQYETIMLEQRNQINKHSAAAFKVMAGGMFFILLLSAALLVMAAQNYLFQNKEEKINWAAELSIANRELSFQNIQKERREAEFVIAKKELVFQTEEKEKRREELLLANKELTFQNIGKERRAAELVMAKKELAFQNEEKEKRAHEFTTTNKELQFKENLAAELIIANKELKEAEDELKEYMHFFNNSNDLCGIAGNKGYFESINTNFSKELGYAEKEFCAIPFIDLIHPDDVASTLKVYRELKSGAPLVNFVNRYRRKDGSYIDLDWNATPNPITGKLYCIARDITERKKVEEQLLAVNAELESFSYSVSHDLRAPLRAINGYTQMLKDDFGNQLSAEADRQMSNIMKNAERMGQLIDELLSFSRLGRQELQKSNVNMHKLVLEVCEELKESNTARDIGFRIQPLLPAQADALAIRQVWVNLISNAVKYSALKEKAVIEIGSKTEGPEIIYSIKDNGAGFDMQYANKLFGVFHRLHPEKEFEGNGVGLAIVQRIVTKHGGRVWAEAKLNEGATFYFTLIKA